MRIEQRDCRWRRDGVARGGGDRRACHAAASRQTIGENIKNPPIATVMSPSKMPEEPAVISLAKSIPYPNPKAKGNRYHAALFKKLAHVLIQITQNHANDNGNNNRHQIHKGYRHHACRS